VIARLVATQLACAFLLCLAFSNSCADLASALASCGEGAASDDNSSAVLISSACPDLVAEIEASQWQELLAPGWQEQMSSRDLPELDFFVSFYSDRASADEVMSLASLDPIVAGLGGDAQQEDSESLWERFINWFGDLLSGGTEYSPNWLSEWLSNIEVSATLIEVVFWVSSALIIVAAVVVIVREVRAARGGRPAGSFKDAQSGQIDDVRIDGRPLTLADLENASRSDKPSILLRLLLQQLEAVGLATHSPARTHRDVRAMAEQIGRGQVDIIARVSESAERIRFGDEEQPSPEIGEVVSAGITVLDELKAARA
jgi:hypothetical protein